MSKNSRLWNPWFGLFAQMAALSLEAQQVMALRMWRLARGGARAEAQRMVAEKLAALSEAQVGATAVMLRGGKHKAMAKNTLRVYRKRVRRNKRRLGR
jgi:hypothetical protein